MEIGIVPAPQETILWPEIVRYLKPAADRGHVPIIENGEICWCVLDDGELVAAATARITTDDVCEVVLVGGRDHHRWIEQLDDRIGLCATESGAKLMRAFGRRGWRKALERQGWRVIGEQDGVTAFERPLTAAGGV